MARALPTIAALEARGPMKLRTFKSDDETWDDAIAQAAEDGYPLAEVIRHYLRAYGAPQRRARRRA